MTAAAEDQIESFGKLLQENIGKLKSLARLLPLLKQTTNFNVSFHHRAIFHKSLENSMILPAALSGRFLI